MNVVDEEDHYDIHRCKITVTQNSAAYKVHAAVKRPRFSKFCVSIRSDCGQVVENLQPLIQLALLLLNRRFRRSKQLRESYS